MRQQLLIVAALIAACGDSAGEPKEPVPIASVTGTYHLTLTSTSESNPGNTCPSMTLSRIGDSVAVAGCSSGLGGHVVGDTIRISMDTDVRYYRFYDFRGTPDDLEADWIGPCTGDLPGSGPGCIRESGRSSWARPAP